jgi:hypothetical protein
VAANFSSPCRRILVNSRFFLQLGFADLMVRL